MTVQEVRAYIDETFWDMHSKIRGVESSVRCGDRRGKGRYKELRKRSNRKRV
jgi:hypothetical protein